MGRVGWIDATRAAGACTIVFLHVLVSTNIACELDVVHRLVYAVLSISLTRWAVPAFFMVSGYLLLDPAREVGWHKALSHAGRMVVTLATFGVSFALIEEVVVAHAAGETLGPILLLRAVQDVLLGRSWDHLWYVYAQLGIYLLLLPVRWVRQRLGERGFEAFAALLYVCVLVVPTVARLEVPNLLIGLACFCIGGRLDRLRLSPQVVSVGICSLAAMLFVSVSGICAGVGDEGYIFLQGSFLATSYAVFVLALLRHFVGEAALEVTSPVACLARESFGIYLVHPFFVHVLLAVVDPLSLAPVLFEVGSFACVLALSYASCKVLRHLPVVRDVI